MKEAASVGVRNLSLAVAGFASEGIDFAARLYRLHHHREARSIARNARRLTQRNFIPQSELAT